MIKDPAEDWVENIGQIYLLLARINVQGIRNMGTNNQLNTIVPLCFDTKKNKNDIFQLCNCHKGY